MPSITPGITLLGLGPGNPEHLTREAWQILESAPEIWLRTSQHPVVSQVSISGHLFSFDDLYETSTDFQEVYATIIARVLELGRRPEGVIYAVPGHPYIAETTGLEISRRAHAEGISVRVVQGLSFLEPVFTALGLDPFPGTALVDALELAALQAPSFPPSLPALIAQIHSRLVASDVKLTLNAFYPDDHPVRMVHAAGTKDQLVESLPLYKIDRSRKIGLLTVLYLPPLDAQSSFESFQEVIARLRAPDGCPWDREQTHLSLRRYLLEEAFEVLEALDEQDSRALVEELGDLLLQILLHAQIASENGDFNMSDVLRQVNQKIVRRHPHVFGDVVAGDSGAVLKNWERLKAEERNDKGKQDAGLLDSVAKALPALLQAEQYQDRASRVGLDFLLGDRWNQLAAEIDGALSVSGSETTALLGELLFSIADLARRRRIDPESALRSANQQFKARVSAVELTVRQSGRGLQDQSQEELLRMWQSLRRPE
jgi:tetrapyrrole methylase family protein / MazG family protein